MTGKKVGSNPSIRLEIIQHPNGGSSDLASNSWFEPQREPNNQTPHGSDNGNSSASTTTPAPEKQLTLFALHLAILEKTASGLGTLAFIWATVVLLGGFAVVLKSKDFWLVTVILLIEGTRVFSRSHELEWQHHQATTWSLASAGRNSFRALVSSSRFLLQAIKAIFQPFSVTLSKKKTSSHIADDLRMVFRSQNKVLQRSTKRTWQSSEVPILPYVGWIFISRNISRVLNWLQLLSAIACAAISLMQLIQQDYGEIQSGEDDKRNRKPALNIFYGLALTEALMFLLEKAYWNWRISYGKLLDKVRKECGLELSDMVAIKRFFYDSYSRCIDGSVFDGLEMDLISFAEELLSSDHHEEQLIGIQILQKFATSNTFAGYTLRKIGTSTPVIERLIEMINWKNPDEEEIRRSAAQIVSKLAGKQQNAIRVAAIPGAMESISTLLYTGRNYNTKPTEICQRFIVADQTDYEFSVFNLLGLLILKKLARDHDNCWKIGNTRGLLAKIIDFTSAGESLLRNDRAAESQIKAVKRSLQTVKMLVSTTGQTGKLLRKEISDIVFTVSNIREILQYGESHIVLQKLGIEILTSLAMDEEAREKIGGTGGVIRLLLSIFFRTSQIEDQKSSSAEAGETLAILALEGRRNCNQIMEEENIVERLVSTLTNPALRINSSRILRNLCTYSGSEHFIQLRGITAALPTVLHAVMIEKEKLLEVSVGLATQIFRHTAPEEFHVELEKAGINDDVFAKQLLQILKTYNHPELKVPRIRRFVIELAIWMMKSHKKYKQLFKNLAAEEVLKSVAETTSELESFNVFSGSVGLGRTNTSLSSLVNTALDLMA